MSNYLEIVMDIDTLEVFEVIDFDEKKEVVVKDTEAFPEEVKNVTMTIFWSLVTVITTNRPACF